MKEKIPFVLTKVFRQSFNKNPCYYYKNGYDFEIDDYYCNGKKIGKYLYHITTRGNLKNIKLNGLKPSRPPTLNSRLKNVPSNFKAVYFALTPDDAHRAMPFGAVDIDNVALRVKTEYLEDKLYLDPENLPDEVNEQPISFVYVGGVLPIYIEYAMENEIVLANFYADAFRPILKYQTKY